MSGSILPALRTALYQRLAGDAVLTGAALASGGVWSVVPPTLDPTAYVLIEALTALAADTFTASGHDVEATVIVWALGSQAEDGETRANLIADRVTQLLDGAPLALSGVAVAGCYRTASQPIEDGDWRGVVLTFRIQAETLVIEGVASLTLPAPQLRATASQRFRGDAVLGAPALRLSATGDNGLFVRYRAGVETLASLGATVTRGTTATSVDANGVLQTAPANVAREGHYINGVGPHLLTEGGRTNGWTWSEDLSQAVYNKRAATVGATQVVAGVTLTKVAEDTANNQHGIQRVAPAITDNTLQTWSFVAKAGERTWLWIQSTDKSGGTAQRAWFNLATGQWGTTAAGATPRAIPLGGGAYRFLVTYNPGASASNASNAFVLFCLADGETATRIGDGVSGAWLGGFQFEADASVGTSYIPTLAAPVSRAPDVISPFTGLPAGTLYERWADPNSGAVAETGAAFPGGSWTPTTGRAYSAFLVARGVKTLATMQAFAAP